MESSLYKSHCLVALCFLAISRGSTLENVTSYVNTTTTEEMEFVDTNTFTGK